MHVREFCNCYLCLPTHKLDAYIEIPLSNHSSVMIVDFFESVYVSGANCVRHKREERTVFGDCFLNSGLVGYCFVL